MDFDLVWQTILIFIIGTIILKVSGRRSISQMTFPQTVIMIAIGTLLIEPVTEKGLWVTFGVAAVLTLSLIFVEYIQLKSDTVETAISGKAILVIENGILKEKNLKKLRLTVDKLEARLRQAGISSISDVEYATLETSGQLGYLLKKEKQPATKEDIQNLIELIKNGHFTTENKHSQTTNLFTEIVKGNDPEVPKRLE